MKTQLLSGVLILASFLTANAQIYTTFESTDGFVTGPALGQNSWSSYPANSNPDNFEISTEYADEGTNSLKILGLGTTQQQGIASPIYQITATDFSITHRIFTPAFDLQNGSSIYYTTLDVVDSTAVKVSNVHFGYNGQIYIETVLGQATAYIGDFEAGVWNTFKAVFNTAAGTVKYYLNDTFLYTANTLGGNTVKAFSFITEDYLTHWYIDNITVALEPTASLEETIFASLSVYPNPANDVVNVASGNDIAFSSAIVTDINGRIIKNVALGNVSEAQLDVSELSSGVYMLTLLADKGSVTRKIIKN